MGFFYAFFLLKLNIVKFRRIQVAGGDRPRLVARVGVLTNPELKIVN